MKNEAATTVGFSGHTKLYAATNCKNKKNDIFSQPTRTLPKNTNRRLSTKSKVISEDDFRSDLETLTRTQLSEKYKSEYGSWRNMKSRRKGKFEVHPQFEDWVEFLRALGPKPAPNYSLDRIDCDDPEYSPSNCRWASPKLQTANRPNTKYVADSSGTSRSLSEWSRLTGVPTNTIRNRLEREWPVDEALCAPVGVRRASNQGVSSSAPYIRLWEKHMKETHAQHFCCIRSKHKKMMKDIASDFLNGGLEPSHVFELILTEWSAFCDYAERNWRAFNSPTFPVVEYVSSYINAAGNYYLTRKKPEQHAGGSPKIATHKIATSGKPEAARPRRGEIQISKPTPTKKERLAALREINDLLERSSETEMLISFSKGNSLPFPSAVAEYATSTKEFALNIKDWCEPHPKQ